MKDPDIDYLKFVISELPEIRWNITEKTGDEGNIYDYGYMGDEIDNIQHMSEEEMYEYFFRIVTVLKNIKEKIDSL